MHLLLMENSTVYLLNNWPIYFLSF